METQLISQVQRFKQEKLSWISQRFLEVIFKYVEIWHGWFWKLNCLQFSRTFLLYASHNSKKARLQNSIMLSSPQGIYLDAMKKKVLRLSCVMRCWSWKMSFFFRNERKSFFWLLYDMCVVIDRKFAAIRV